MSNSETSSVRDLLGRYCIGDGVDVGFGGDPIVPTAICLDMKKPYTNLGDHPQHLHGSAFELPFKDDVLDYVYSSHLIEDFSYTCQSLLLHEWSRVVRVGGLIIIVAPDQMTYARHCEKTGQPMNAAHRYDSYSLENFIQFVLRNEEYYALNLVMNRNGIGAGGYSWCVVLEKKGVLE